MREKRQAAWRHLNLNERDVLTVLSAVCKVLSRSVPKAPLMKERKCALQETVRAESAFSG